MRTNIILAALAAILAWPCWLKLESERTEDFTKEEDLPLLFPGFSADNVHVIEIARRKSEDEIKRQNLQGALQFERLVFVRGREGWMLKDAGSFENLKIDSALVERDVLDQIASIKLDKETLVEADKVDDAYRTENELTELNGTIIVCRGAQGRELVQMILGKSTSRGREGTDAVKGYLVVRPDRPKEVVLYEPRSEYWRLSLRPSDWADKKIHQFLMSDVATFYFKNSMGQAGFERKKGAEETWLPIPDLCPKDVGDVKQAEVSNLVNRYLTVNAESFSRGKVDTDGVGAEVEVRATLRDGTEFVLQVEKVVEGKLTRLAVSSAHAFLFEIADFNVLPFSRQDPKDLFVAK